MSNLDEDLHEFGKSLQQSLRIPELAEDVYIMTGIREVKRFFGILHYKCPLCKERIRYYNILYQASDDEKNPVGKQRLLPLHYLVFTKEWGWLDFGICLSNHKIVRIGSFFGHSVFQLRGEKMVTISVPNTFNP